MELPPIGNGRHRTSKILTVLLFAPRLVLASLFVGLGTLGWLLARAFELALWPVAQLVDRVGRIYPSLLAGAVRLRWVVVPLTFAALLLALLLLPTLGTRLVPDLAQGEFAFRLQMPEGTPLETTAQIVERIEAPLVADAQFAGVFSIAGSLPAAALGRQERGENLAQINFVLLPGSGVADEARAVRRVRQVLGLYPAVDAELLHPSLLTLRPPVAVHVFGDDLSILDRAAARALEVLRGLPLLTDVTTTAEPGSPEIRVELDREKAGTLGVQAEALSRSLQRQIQGEVVGQFREEQERIDIRLRAAEPYRSRASKVEDLRVRLEDGTAVPVAALANVVVDRGPAAIHRVAGSRVVELSARAPAADLGAALAATRRAIGRLDLPPGTAAEMAGQDEDLKVSFDSLKLALALAVFLVYVVMAMQFESLLHPFVILLAVPMGLIGVVAALLVSRTAISVLVLIGVVMLSGIVVNNAIVLVDAINRRRRHEAQALEQAIFGAGSERLRPILMTTSTTVLALSPMAVGLGAGDELRAPLAVTVIGGLLGGTLLTLLVTPCLYRILSGGSRRPRTETRAASPGSGLAPQSAVRQVEP